MALITSDCGHYQEAEDFKSVFANASANTNATIGDSSRTKREVVHIEGAKEGTLPIVFPMMSTSTTPVVASVEATIESASGPMPQFEMSSPEIFDDGNASQSAVTPSMFLPTAHSPVESP